MNYLEWIDKFLCKINKPKVFVKNEIIDAIKNDKPLSYVRFGDGELILLREYFKVVKHNSYYANLCNPDDHIDKLTYFTINDNNILEPYVKRYHNNIMNTWYYSNRWNVNDDYIKFRIIKNIGESLIGGLQQSSYIGIWELSDDITKIENFYLHTHTYIPHIELFEKCKVNFQKLTSGFIHREPEFADPYEFKKILNGKPLHIFTCNEHKLRTVIKLDELLEAEITYTNLTPTLKDWKTFSFAHQDFLEDRCKDIKEQIVLFGLGYGAKHIPAFLSNNFGKTCIDVGAILDGWSGKITRPYMDNYKETGEIMAF